MKKTQNKKALFSVSQHILSLKAKQQKKTTLQCYAISIIIGILENGSGKIWASKQVLGIEV